MIQLSFKQATHFQNISNQKEFSYRIKKKYLVVGRGEELEEREDKSHDIVNLKDFDNTLSRLHAIFMFSPTWLKKMQPATQKQMQKVPKYFYQFSKGWQIIPENCLQQIWDFIKPSKKCILRDLNSKLGLYKSIEQEVIVPEMKIAFGQTWTMEIMAQIKFNSIQDLLQIVKQQERKGQKIMGNTDNLLKSLSQCKNLDQRKCLLKIMQLKCFSSKEQNQEKYILLIENGKVLRIGRGSNSDISLKSSSISRYQAYLKCSNYKWEICDGNQQSRSLNGTWKKIKQTQIQTKIKQHKNSKQQQEQYRIGSIKCQITLQELPWMDFDKILTQSEGNQKDQTQTLNYNNNNYQQNIE